VELVGGSGGSGGNGGNVVVVWGAADLAEQVQALAGQQQAQSSQSTAAGMKTGARERTLRPGPRTPKEKGSKARRQAGRQAGKQASRQASRQTNSLSTFSRAEPASPRASDGCHSPGC
jgi:hypothetical protein